MMSTDQTTVFMDHIREHATQYFTDFESTQVEVKFDEKQERIASILYQFTVCDDEQNHGILVKVPYYRGLSASGSGDSYFKPRLFPKTEPRDMHRFEYTALRTIYDYFSNLDEKNLGTIRVLDYLPEYHAILTEASTDTNLRQLFLQTSRLHARFTPSEIDLPFRNVGRWLRFYHEMSKEDNVTTRHANRRDYIDAVAKLTDFLATSLGDKPFFQKVASVLEANALQILPDLLPLGLGHGDFALRNILVGENDHVTVLDTFAKWRTPIYEDIGYFLNGLKRPGPQVASQGLLFGSEQLSAYEHAFLEGYFEQKPIPYPEIRLYEMLALLDKWASIITYSHQRTVKFRNFNETKVALASRYFKISAKRLLNQVAKGKSR